MGGGIVYASQQAERLGENCLEGGCPGQMLGRLFPRAHLGLSQPGLSIHGGIGKPRVSDFPPGSPGMCVCVRVHTLMTWAIRIPCEAVSRGQDRCSQGGASEGVFSFPSPTAAIPLSPCGKSGGLCTFFSSPSSVSGSFSRGLAQHGGLG